jgi:hypothetical protein
MTPDWESPLEKVSLISLSYFTKPYPERPSKAASALRFPN